MIQGKVSINYIISKLYRDLGINSEIEEDSVSEWVSEALLFIGAFDQFETKIEELTIEGNKVKLPCGFYKLQEISYSNQPLYYAGKSLVNNYFCEDCKISTLPNISPNGYPFQTFYINDSYIVTSLEEGTICVSYLSIPVDENGLPTIPDDVYYMKACTAYVTKMIDYRMWRKGSIPDKVFKHSENEWDFYCGGARGAANMPDTQKMENLKNILIRLIPKQNEYNLFFKNNSTQEAKKIQ